MTDLGKAATKGGFVPGLQGLFVGSQPALVKNGRMNPE
jgi:hypothetical protein